MQEMTTVYQFFAGMIGLSISVLLYMLGGREYGFGKWQRRFVGSFILALTVNGLCAWRGIWSPWMMTIYPALCIGFSMGYGGDRPWIKFVRRFVYATGVLSAGVIMTLIIGGAAWVVLIPHIGIGVWSVWMGYKNPIESAAEEGAVCAMLNIGLLCYPFINS